MKKIVLTIAALALSGGATMAEVSVSGSAKMGLQFVDEESNKKGSKVDTVGLFRITFSASGETDGGVSFGATGTFNTHESSEDVLKNGYVTMDNETEVYISNPSWGKVTIGSVDDAEASGVGNAGLDIGIGDDAESTGRGGSADLRYDHKIAMVSVAVSTDLSKDAGEREWGISMGYAAAPVTVGIGINSQKVLSAGLGYSFGDISGQLSYQSQRADGVPPAKPEMTLTSSTPDDEKEAAGKADTKALAAHFKSHGLKYKASSLAAHVNFKAGDTTITVAASRCSGDEKNAGCGEVVSSGGIGMALNLGGGAELKGGFGVNKNKAEKKITKADFGIAMSF